MELGVAKRVIFHGPQQHVESYMQAADCFVCPSLWAEAAGLVNLEAQSTGLPVIASNIGGIPEYVADGETGLLFPAGDTTELTERIHRVMTDALLRERLGRSARRFMEGHFSPDARLDDLVAAYHSTIARC
jgi:glycosyltransferase involved in cell wall biosynthesis